MAARVTNIKWKPGRFERKIKTRTDKLVSLLAEEVVDDAQMLVPVKTGELKNSIDKEDKHTRETSKAVVTADTKYALIVEIGTEKRSPHPYLRPALEGLDQSDINSKLRQVRHT